MTSPSGQPSKIALLLCKFRSPKKAIWTVGPVCLNFLGLTHSPFLLDLTLSHSCQACHVTKIRTSGTKTHIYRGCQTVHPAGRMFLYGPFSQWGHAAGPIILNLVDYPHPTHGSTSAGKDNHQVAPLVAD